VNPVLLAVVAGVLALGLAWSLWSHRQERLWLEHVRRSIRRFARGEDQRLATAGSPGSLDGLAQALDELVRALGEESRGMRSELRIEQEMARRTPNGLVLVDEAGLVRVANPAARSLVVIRAEPVGRSPIEAFALAELHEVIAECRSTGQVEERTVVHQHRDLVVRGVPLDAGGALGVILDITTVRQAERARRDFVSNVSHELRTPITAILGFAEALAQEELPEKLRPMVATIERNSRRLHALVDDVLHLSRIEARGHDLPLARQPLAPLLRELPERFASAAEARGLRLCFEVPPHIEAEVNDEALTHAVANLVDNAIKYGRGGTKVEVRVVEAADGVRVSVTDDGPGIEASHHARLFERFYRVDAGRSREVGGTGLGLALVKHLCIAMGAEVSVRSAPGEGATFTIRLRRGADEATGEEPR
jgi:two-component system phosphate regulon sensor histidine kinase PhoR